MKELAVRNPEIHRAFLNGSFVVHKTSRKFSGIALDQAHEQLNDLIKGDGGAVGLTENPSALLRWVIAGPEIARVIEEFEASSRFTDTAEDFRHHEQVPGTQRKFISNVKELVATIAEMGNPFQEDSTDLMTLDSREVMSGTVVETVKNIEQIGKSQYTQYIEERLYHHTKAIAEPIKKNNLPLFNNRPAKNSKSKSQVASLKNDCILFSRLYIACQSRDGNLEEFFKHENQECPPALSQTGNLRTGSKADILECLSKVVPPVTDAPTVDAKVLDGSVIVHLLQPGATKTFQEYADHIFKSYILSQLEKVERLDIVWDVYRPDSLKQGARENRGKGTRRRVKAGTAIPGNWESFLRVNDNKTELFDYLGKFIVTVTVPGKEIYSTNGDTILCSASETNRQHLEPCSHEEADSRIMLHVADQVRQGHKRILIRTVDSDVVVLAVATAQQLQSDLEELWIAFGTARHYRYLSAHAMCQALGPDKSRVLPLFHAFTGCDTVSAFAGKGKRSAWEAWNVFPDLTKTFLGLMDLPPGGSIPGDLMTDIERFVVILYHRSSQTSSVNMTRKDLFTKNPKSLELLPPTQAALEQHLRRTVYQAVFCWGQALLSCPVLPSPVDWGWKRDVSTWIPLWTTLPEATDTCYELVHCSCKKGCTNRCKCKKASLTCTALCGCAGDCFLRV